MESNKDMSTKKTLVILAASLLILIGSIFVFSVISANLSTGFVDFRGLTAGVELQLSGLGLLFISTKIK
jgi:hypothetical protein